MMWILAALTMTVGNLIALRQTNVVRLFAYSSVAQAGFILAPLAVVGNEPDGRRGRHPGGRQLPHHLHGDEPRRLRGDHRGAAARPARASSPPGAACSSTRPAWPSPMSVFLFALAGIPPLGGWFAKFQVFRAILLGRAARAPPCSAVVVAVNSVIALYYYAGVARRMLFEPAARRRPHAGQGAVRHHPRAGRHAGRHRGVRVLPRSGRPLRRRRHRPRCRRRRPLTPRRRGSARPAARTGEPARGAGRQAGRPLRSAARSTR